MSSKPLSLKKGLLIGGIAALILSVPVILFLPTGWVLHVGIWVVFVGTVAMNVGAIATMNKNWGLVAVASGFMIPCMLAFALVLAAMRDAGERSSACDQAASLASKIDAPNFAFQGKPLRGSPELGC